METPPAEGPASDPRPVVSEYRSEVKVQWDCLESRMSLGADRGVRLATRAADKADVVHLPAAHRRMAERDVFPHQGEAYQWYGCPVNQVWQDVTTRLDQAKGGAAARTAPRVPLPTGAPWPASRRRRPTPRPSERGEIVCSPLHPRHRGGDVRARRRFHLDCAPVIGLDVAIAARVRMPGALGSGDDRPASVGRLPRAARGGPS